MAHQGSSRSFRPIAPRALVDGHIPEPPAPEDNKMRRASTACTECKRRRTKCSADTTGTPCAECALHNRECVIDEYADKRRKVAARRDQEDLRYYRGFLERLLEAIRFGDGITVESIIEVIRSGATQDEIHAVVSRSLGGRPKREPPSNSDASLSSTNHDKGSTSNSTPDGWT